MNGLIHRSRLGGTDVRWLALLGAACVALGVLAGMNPKYGIAAAVGIAFVAIVIENTTVGLILFTFLSFLEVLRSGGAGGSFMKVAGLLLFASWVANAQTRGRRTGASLYETTPTLVIAGVFLVAWSAMSVAWAESAGSAVTATYRYLLNLLLIPIVFTSVRSRKHVLWFAAAFVLGAVVSAAYGFVHPIQSTAVGAQNGRLTGTVGDANDQAAVLVAAIALAFGLVVALRQAPLLRLLAILAVIISLAGVVNTLSRSGLLALGIMLIAAVLFGGRWRKWAALLLLLSAFGAVTYFVAFAPQASRARVTSGDTSGRSTIWVIGWRMVKANPVLGVGAGNFAVTSIHYLNGPGELTRADLIVDTPKVAHNIYLELQADLGLPGLIAFVTIVLSSAAAAIRAARIFESRGESDLEVMSRCVVLSLVGFMASDFFLSGQFSKQLWLMLAFGPTLLSMARMPDTAAARDGTVNTSTSIVDRRRHLAGAPV
jgi:O-antigen ligase